MVWATSLPPQVLIILLVYALGLVFWGLEGIIGYEVKVFFDNERGSSNIIKTVQLNLLRSAKIKGNP